MKRSFFKPDFIFLHLNADNFFQLRDVCQLQRIRCRHGNNHQGQRPICAGGQFVKQELHSIPWEKGRFSAFSMISSCKTMKNRLLAVDF